MSADARNSFVVMGLRRRVAAHARALVAVLYRQAGLIVACALVGAAGSLVLSMRQPHVRESTAVVPVRSEQRGSPSVRSGIPADRGTTNPDPVADGGLRLDLDPDAGNVRNPRSPQAGSEQRLAKPVRENTRRETELDRLERARQLAQRRVVELQRELDQLGRYLRLNSAEAERRVIIDAPDPPAAGDGKTTFVALLGPLAGLLLGLVLAALRELGGDRMRSPREAERALGVPVLGAIPTLSAKARSACFGPPMGAQGVARTAFA